MTRHFFLAASHDLDANRSGMLARSELVEARDFFFLALLCVWCPLSANATLVGDSIYGVINFDITGTQNFFDPIFGHVPAPNSGIQPFATVTDLDFGGPGGVVPGAIIASTNFSGLTLTSTDHGIHVSYIGGQDIPTPAGGLIADIVLTATPEPGTSVLLGIGPAFLAGRSRAQR